VVYQIPQQAGKSINFDMTPGLEILLVVLAQTPITEFDYGDQKIAIQSPAGAAPQRVTQANIAMASSSKGLVIEDDGVVETVVANPAMRATDSKKPLVATLKLAHK
jgi:hypothetical protein